MMLLLGCVWGKNWGAGGLLLVCLFSWAFALCLCLVLQKKEHHIKTKRLVIIAMSLLFVYLCVKGVWCHVNLFLMPNFLSTQHSPAPTDRDRDLSSPPPPSLAGLSLSFLFSSHTIHAQSNKTSHPPSSHTTTNRPLSSSSYITPLRLVCCCPPRPSSHPHTTTTPRIFSP